MLVGGSEDDSTLNATLGNPNDAGGAEITPSLSGIEVVNVAFTSSSTAMTLNMQDAEDVEQVHVTRVSGSKTATVDDMDSTVTTLSVKNSSQAANVQLLYRDAALKGDQTVTVTLDNALITDLYVGSTAVTPTEQIETLKIVTTGSASSVTLLDNLADNVATTKQTISIEAGADLEISGIADDTEVYTINVSGAADVTLGEVGNRTGSTVAGASHTGALTANITNLVDDSTGSVTSGSGDDVITSSDGNAATYAADLEADVTTGAGDDSVTIDGSVINDELTGADRAGSISTGDGDDTVSVAGGVEVNASISAGEGADSVTLGGTIGAAVAANTDSDVDGSINLGAGDDTLTFDYAEVGTSSREGTGGAGITAISGSVDGGDGTDTLVINSNETATTVAASLATNADRVTGIETLRLISRQSLSNVANANTDDINAAAGATVVKANDLDMTTADFTVDAGEFTGLSAIELVNDAKVISVTNNGATSYFAGDAASYTITGLAGQTIKVTADETGTGNANRDVGVGATAYATAVAADVTADAVLSLKLATLATGTKQSSETADDVVAITIEGTGDVSIADAGDGTRTGTNDDIEGLSLTINGSADRTIALSANDFLNSLTVAGDASGALAFTNVEADEIDMTAMAADLTVTLDDDDDKVIELGSGDDVLNALADTVNEDDTIDGGSGTDRLIVDVLASATNITENDDEVFESISAIEEVELRSDADVVLDDDADATGVTTVIVDSTSTTGSMISIQSDFNRGLAVTSESASVTEIDNDADVDLTVTVEQLGADTTLTLTDAGKGAVSVTVTADDIATDIDSTNVGGSNNSEFKVTVAAGSIDTLVVKDSKAAASAGGAVAITGAVTVTTDAAWAGAGETLVIDVSDLNDDDVDAEDDGDLTDDAGDINDDQTVTINASASVAGDYKVNVKGSALVDTVTGTANADTIDGAAGADVITGAGGADTLTGGTGADTFKYTAVSESTGATADSITDFTTGSDKIQIAFTSTAATISVAGFANNKASVADSLVTLSGTAGDWFYATNGSVAVDVDGNGNIQDGIDYLIDVTGAVAAADVNFVITGDGGAQTITGGAGADTINAGAGADIITGGLGIDTIDLGAADTDNDKVVFTSASTANRDVVSNFEVGGDIIGLTEANFASINFANTAAGTATGVALNAGDYNEIAAAGALAADKVNVITTQAGYASYALAHAAVTAAAGEMFVLFYNSATSKTELYWDADGSTSAGGVLIGSFDIAGADVTNLSQANFAVFG